MGSQAIRTTRQVSQTLGRRSAKRCARCWQTQSKIQYATNYEAQIEYHKLPVQARQLQRKLKERTNGGQRYKCAFVKKEISKKNRESRTAYGYQHCYKPIEDFYSYVVFTDEAHIDPASQAVGDILREQGKRYSPENHQERPERKRTRFHIAAWISWYGKAEKLEFYNDEEDYVEQPSMPPKPRRRPTTESKAEYQARLEEWEALKPHKIEVKVGGNHMTQKYYTERLLPVYIDAIHQSRM